MTTFIISCAVLVGAALIWLIVPILRTRPSDALGAQRSERRISALLIAVLTPALAGVMYASLSNWNWNAVEMEAAGEAEMNGLLRQLEAKLEANPADVNGWLLLGRSHATAGNFSRAVDAYQRAYDVSKGDNLEAIIGLGEALAFLDETSLGGRAGELFEAAFAKAPDDPRALWYSAMAALRAGDLRTGRDRMQSLLARNPPPELRGVIERQVQDLTQQLGEKGEGAATPAAAAEARAIHVAVSIAPEIQKQLGAALPLFILARDPAGGAPLAVQRHSSSAAPLNVTLTSRDAMLPTRTIASASRVQIVARLSKSGAAQAQAGDFYGEADYDFTKAEPPSVAIVIDRIVQ